YEDMIDENATYGKVFFDHVYTDGALNSNLSNKAFYFKRKLDEDGNDTGVIIFDRNAFTNYHTSYTSLINDGDLIPAATEGEQALTRPRPEDCLVFFWN
ncbi:MAG: hypothetical protein MJA84_18260, partial [Firmicutes bacterium]|nr:hypothetical protein [Bacillota bacterium]